MFDRLKKALAAVRGRTRTPARSRGTTRLAGRDGACRWAIASALTAVSVLAIAGDDAVNRWPSPAASDLVPPPVPGGDLGQLTRYTSLNDFLDATADLDLSIEDFSNGFTNFGDPDDCHQAVGSDSDDACFAPGDLLPGFAIRSSRGSIFGENGDSDIVALGPGFLGTPSKVLGAYQPDPPHGPTHVTFEPDVIAVAMDLYDGLTGQSISVIAYDADQTVLGSFTVTPTQLNQPTFTGITSPVPIDRIEINALNPGGAELLGNLHFGGHAAQLAAVDETIDFGVVPAGRMATHDVTLTNAGDLDLSVSAVPSAPEPFAWTADGCTGQTLPAGAECTMTLAFTPSHEGRFRRHLDVPVDASELLHVTLRAEAQVPRLTPAPGHTHFGDIAVGSQSEIRSVQLRNLGGGEVTVLDVGTALAPFVASGGSCGATPFVLAPGDSCSLDYRFAPTAAGDFAATVPVTLDGNGVARPGLSGRGTGR